MSAAEASQQRTAGRITSTDVLRLPASPVAVGIARHRIRGELLAAGVGRALTDDVEVVVSELLGNAVRHARPIAGGAVLVAWRVSAAEVMVRVTDGGSPGRVAARTGDVLAETGRGLQIVDGLAAEWGVVDHVGGLRTVWARLAAPVRSAGPDVLRLLV